MAASQEIAQINEIEKGLSKLNSTLNQTANNYLTLVKTISDSNQIVKENVVSFDGLEKAKKRNNETSKELDALAKRLEASERRLKDLIGLFRNKQPK
jgi:methyl-accepting chemotaxis protein